MTYASLSRRVLQILIVSCLLGPPTAAQPTVFFSDFRQLGRVDAPNLTGPLEPSILVPSTSPQSGLAELPDGSLLEVGRKVQRVDPATFQLTELAELEIYCSAATADADGNVWCTHQSDLFCLEAGTYDVALRVNHPALRFRGIASLGPRLFAVARLDDDPIEVARLVEIDPATGGASVLHPIPLPASPDGVRTFDFQGMDFDDNGDLWLGAPLYLPAVTLPPPPDGHIVRVLDPLGGAVVRTPQPLLGTTTPSVLVRGAPTIVAIPTVGPAGLSLLVSLLLLSALAMLGRRPAP